MKIMEKNTSPWLVMIVLTLACMMVLINLGTLNVTLPVITRHFNADAVTSNWILLSYMLFSTVLILIFGPLADIFGRRRLYLWGLVIFIIASLLIGFSPNIWMLLLFRVIQAVGGALIITNQTALITDAFPPELLGKGIGLNVLFAGLAQLLGPIVGGFLASAFDWRWVFWFNVPLGFIAYISGLFILKGVNSKASGDRVDIFGSLIIFLSLGSLIFAFSESSVTGWNNWAVILSIIIFIIFTPLFIFVERHTASPMFDFTLFRNRSYAMANLSTFLSFFTQTATVLLISLYYQVAENNTSFQAGLKIVPIMIGMLIFSPISSSLINRYSVQKLSSGGLAITGIGLSLLIMNLGSGVPYWSIALALSLVGIGFGIFLPPNTTAIMTLVPTHRRGTANGIRSMLNNMGQLLSTSISLMIVIALLPVQLKNTILSASTSTLSRTDFQLITTSFRWGLFSLLVASILGTVASLLRDPIRNS